MTENAIRIGVAGVGSLGRHHARVASGLEGAVVSGVYDADPERGDAVAREFALSAFRSLDELLERSDAIVVATPTISHREVAAAALVGGSARSRGEADHGRRSRRRTS